MKKILLFAIAALLLVAFNSPAMAVTKKVTFYGDIRFQTYWINKDEDYYSNGRGDDDSDLMWEPDTILSRFGARFVEGPIKANVEIRPRRNLWSSRTTKYKYYDMDSGEYKEAYIKAFQQFWRQWWASWNFGPALLLVGFTFAPGFICYSQSQIDYENHALYGDFQDELRAFQMRLTVPLSFGKFTLAAIEPPGKWLPQMYGTVDGWSATTAKGTDYDYKIPKLEARLDFNINRAQITLLGGYYTFDIVDKGTEHNESVDSYMYGARVIVPFGPFYVKTHYVYVQNPGNFGDLSSVVLHFRNMFYNSNTGKTVDADYYSYGGVAGFQINNMISVEAGYFYQKTERYQDEEDPNCIYYVVLPIRPIKGVTIYPEIGVYDDKDYTSGDGRSHDQGKRTFVGAYWKINF